MEEKNPYEDPKRKGCPKRGQANEFFEWARNKRLAEYQNLSPAARKAALAEDEHFARKMAS